MRESTVWLAGVLTKLNQTKRQWSSWTAIFFPENPKLGFEKLMNSSLFNLKKLRPFISLLICISICSCSKPVFYYFFTPKDYYSPLASGIIDVGSESSSYAFEFTHKYEGNHSIGISYQKKQSAYYQELTMGFTAKVSIYQNDKQLLSKFIQEPLMPYLFGYNKIGGFIFFFYKTPKDLPINIPLTCIIEIKKGNPVFEKSYGKAEFFISKSSEE